MGEVVDWIIGKNGKALAVDAMAKVYQIRLDVKCGEPIDITICFKPQPYAHDLDVFKGSGAYAPPGTSCGTFQYTGLKGCSTRPYDANLYWRKP